MDHAKIALLLGKAVPKGGTAEDDGDPKLEAMKSFIAAIKAGDAEDALHCMEQMKQCDEPDGAAGSASSP